MPRSTFRALTFAAATIGLMAFQPAIAADAPTTPAPAQAAAPAAPADPVVAKVDGLEIHRSELQALLPQLPPQYRQMPFEMLFEALLDQLVNQKLIQAAGYKAGYQNEPEVKAAAMEAERRAVQKVFLSKKLDERMTPEALDEAYKQFVAENPAQEEVKAAHILVDNEDAAKAIIADIKKGGDFAKIAAEKSIDKAAGEQGGDLGYFTKDMMVEPFANAAFAMKAGEISETPVKSEFGWHIIKVTDKRQKPIPTREAAEPQLRQQLAEELVTAMLADLRTQSKVELFNADGSPRPAVTTPPAAEPAKK